MKVFEVIQKPNQLRGTDKAKLSKPKDGPEQRHPFRGKLVGNEMIENATAGATSVGAVATVPNAKNSKKRPKMWKPSDNALDMKNTNLFGGPAIKR